MATNVHERILPEKGRPLRRTAGLDTRFLSSLSSDTIVSYFRDHFPVFLDGTLADHAPGNGGLARQARITLARDPAHSGRMPAEALREILGTLAGQPCPATKAGLCAIGPHHARVWWDASVVDSLDDVLGRLHSPRLVLRVYDITGLDPESGRWHGITDIDVSLPEGGRTIELAAADRSYIADLGYVYGDGRFLRLARTTVADLPRNGPGHGDPAGTARSRLPIRDRHAEAAPAIDREARAWVAARRVTGKRDIQAELVLHTIYRAFLQEGPRALRRAPRLSRRWEPVIEASVHALSGRTAPSSAQTETGRSDGFLVARLDPEREQPSLVISYLPATVAIGEATLWRRPEHTGGGFRWLRSLLACARLDLPRETPARKKLAGATVAVHSGPERAGTTVLRREVERADPTVLATPVFAAAEHLRRSLSGMRYTSSEPTPAAPAEEAAPSLPLFGGSEAKRMAKAGVSFTRMTLTLEGRMRPGARLKVAGRLVCADAEGRFRLDCVLSGRKASIPMRAGPSAGGEARSLINVEWGKRAGREKHKVH